MLTLEYGSTGVGNEIDVVVPPNETIRVLDGVVLGGAASQVIEAYADRANVVNLVGRVETLT